LLIAGVTAAMALSLVCQAAMQDAIAQAGPSVSTSEQGNAMSNVLVTPATADTTKPTVFTVDLSKSSISPGSRLELSVSPENISPQEAYVVVVTPVGAPEKQLGSFAFFPPPRPGEVRKFYVDVPTDALRKVSDNKGKVDLSVELVPVERGRAITSSTVRILSARVVGGP
jgi:hypothetical protein